MIKTTVKAHTGSTKFGTYKVVTGELKEWRRRELGPNHYTVDAVIVDAEGVEYVTGRSRVIEMESEVVAVVEEAREPRKLVFETVVCGRCKGAGRRNDNGWGANHQGLCYRCDGAGTITTANGYRARQAYRKLIDARLGTTFGELADGEAFWLDGKCYAKGSNPCPTLQDGSKVRRHDGPATRQVWKEIAAKYKGATLVY